MSPYPRAKDGKIELCPLIPALWFGADSPFLRSIAGSAPEDDVSVAFSIRMSPLLVFPYPQ
jgi:hypothetical protein